MCSQMHVVLLCADRNIVIIHGRTSTAYRHVLVIVMCEIRYDLRRVVVAVVMFENIVSMCLRALFHCVRIWEGRHLDGVNETLTEVLLVEHDGADNDR